jgi:putative ABC transport system permease protein
VFLALREIRRAAVRFGLLMASVGLLVFLILFQQTLQNGLITSFIGAIENQSAPVLVYSVDGRRNLQGSVITPPMQEAIESVDAVGRAARVGQGTFTVRSAAGPETAVVIGFEEAGLGAPTTLRAGRLPATDGEAVALDTAPDGFGIGDTVAVEPGGLRLTVVGLASEIGYLAAPTLFTTYGTWEQAVRSANPDATGALPSVIAVEPAAGRSPESAARAINAAVTDADALTRAEAVAETPGVAQVRQSFQLIFLLYGLVVPLVTGLFFLIVTLQKANSLTLLRALGVPGGRLVRSLLVQVSIVMAVGLGLGVALYSPVSSGTVGGLPLRFQTGAVIFWAVVLFLLGLLSSLVSARRVLRIDPIQATTGAGVGR